MYEYSLYKYTYTHHISMSTFKRVDRLDLKIHEVGHKNVSPSTEISSTTERIISHKYTTHISNLEFKPE
jgi:hypothetical protein